MKKKKFNDFDFIWGLKFQIIDITISEMHYRHYKPKPKPKPKLEMH